MKQKKIKNIFSLLLAVAALTRSSLVNAFPPKSPEAQPTDTLSESTPTKSTQVVKKTKASSTALTTKQKTLTLAHPSNISLKTFSTILPRAPISFTLEQNKLNNIPVLLQNSTMQIIIYRFCPDDNGGRYLAAVMTQPELGSKITIPYAQLDCTKEYTCLVSILQTPKESYSGIRYSYPKEQKLLTAPKTTSSSQALTTRSESDTTQSFEFIGSFNIKQDEIAKQQNALKRLDILKCLKAYKLWHAGEINIDLKKYYEKIKDETSHESYTSHLETFKKIISILKIISYINKPNVVEIQDHITKAIDTVITDDQDKTNLKTLLDIAVAEKTTKPTTTA